MKNSYLLLDTAEEISRVLMLNNNFIQQESLITKEKSLLPVMKKVSLKTKNLKAVDGIISVIGPGEFSKVRQGVVWSNTLAWALGLPLKGVSIGDTIRKGHWTHKSLVPVYNRPPNIT